MIIAFKSCEVSIVHPLQSYRAIVCLSEQQGSGTNLPALEAWLCFYKPCVTDAGGTCLKLLCAGASHATVSFVGYWLTATLFSWELPSAKGEPPRHLLDSQVH